MIWTIRPGNRLVIRPHPCMGDHIICNGLYRYLARKWEVTVLAVSKNVKFVKMMLDDAPINVIEVGREWDMDDYANRTPHASILRLGFCSEEPFNRWHFDMEWYRQAGVPFENRWTNWKMPEITQVPLPDKPYAFVHDRPDMFGAAIGPIPNEVRPDSVQPIFAYRDLIKGASEVHCVSSRFAAFADCFDLGGKPLFFYAFGRETPAHRNQWQYMN